jgi:hypothetical protein
MSKNALILSVLLIFSPCSFAGAWGSGSFENDDAADWLAELEDASGTRVLVRALNGVNPKSKYIEAPECSVALAASEVVAAARGKPAEKLPPEVMAWIKRSKPRIDAALLEAARSAVQTCRDFDGSELRELWTDSKQSSPWLSETAALLERLK